MSYGKVGIVGVKYRRERFASHPASLGRFANNFDSLIDHNSRGNISRFSFGRSQDSPLNLVTHSSYSSNTPGFIGVKINKGIDDNRLKGGFRKL